MADENHRQSVTGFFILMGDADLPFVYNVRTVRNGKSFCVRSVEVTQEETKGACFTCTCSFKRPDATPIEFQETEDIGRKYAMVLKGKKPSDHRDALSIETPWFVSPMIIDQVATNPLLQVSQQQGTDCSS